MKRIKRFVYRFKLSRIMKIHDVIFIIHFKLIIDFISNSYKRYFIVLLSIIINNEKKYKIEYLIKKRRRRFERFKSII